MSCTKRTDTVGNSTKMLVVSIEPQRNVLEHLVDSTYTVRTLLTRDADPETFEPSMNERVMVDSAAAYFVTGVLSFENSFKRSSDDITFVNTGEGVDFIFDTHGHCDHHDHGVSDPHFWSSVAGARTMAHNMAAYLVEAYPEDSVAISHRLSDYDVHLDSVMESLKERLAPYSGKSFAVWHPSLSYFAREYGLNQIWVGIEGKEMSAKGLKDAIEKAKDTGVKVFFYQKGLDSRQAISINEGIGSRIVEIYPLDYDWENQLNIIADEIAGAQ